MADRMKAPDEETKPVSGETEGAMKSGGESQGDGPPLFQKGEKPDFHGGQTEQGYYGHGQLGDKKVGEGNPNAPSTSSDKE